MRYIRFILSAILLHSFINSFITFHNNVFTLDGLERGILLDELGYHLPYDSEYLSIIQSIEGINHSGELIKVSQQKRIKEDIGRLRKKQIVLVRKKRRKTPTVIIDNRAWNIKQCQQRFAVNPKDGDARFVLGGYYVLSNEYEKAIELLKITDSSTYNTFSERDILELRGYTFYKLARFAKKKKDSDRYFNYLEKEQQVYLTARKREIDEDHFQYLYSLTFIDLGLYLEAIERKGESKTVVLPKSISIQSSKEAYENALWILLTFRKSDNVIFGRRAFLYTKLGRPLRAAQERKLQGRAIKMSLYEKERGPIREKIISELVDSMLFKESFLKEYVQQLDRVYTDTTDTSHKNLDSIIHTYCDRITSEKINEYPEINYLSLANKQFLFDDIGFHISKKITDSLRTLQKDHLWRLIFTRIRKKRYKAALQLINAYGILLAEGGKFEELAMLKEGLQEALYELKEKGKKLMRQIDTLSSGQKAEKAAKEKKKEVIPMHVRVGQLIDDLIAKREFISAYRGVKAYEKILKANYDDKKIDTIINDLEKLIEKDYGKKYLRKLKKELKS